MGLKGHSVLSLLFLAVIAVMLIPMFSSCGKEGAASPTGLNTQLNIINIRPDGLPLYLFINLTQQNAATRPYIYGSPSGYFYLTSLQTPIQLRTKKNATVYTRDSALNVNCKYSFFITGLVADKTDTTIFTVDTSSAPALGRAKVRFVNAAARSVNVDIFANGTAAFKNRGFLSVSGYLEIPAGLYDFKIYAAGTSTVLADLPNTTVQDGRLYTLYTRGVVLRTDSAAFVAGIIINR